MVWSGHAASVGRTGDAMPDTAPRAWQVVLERIEADLRDGRLAAGDRLTPERELAAQLGVGRSSVREAIVETVVTEPAACAARATATSPSGCWSPVSPVGAAMIGSAISPPSTVVRRSNVCSPRPPASRSAKRVAIDRSSERYRPTG